LSNIEQKFTPDFGHNFKKGNTWQALEVATAVIFADRVGGWRGPSCR
jgi:hypothetical protein